MTTEHKPQSNQRKTDLELALPLAEFWLDPDNDSLDEEMSHVLSLLSRGLLGAAAQITNCEEQLETLRDALNDVRDVVNGWTRQMTYKERNGAIQVITSAAFAAISNPASSSECDHDWDLTSIDYGPPGGSYDVDICRKCGAERDPAKRQS